MHFQQRPHLRISYLKNAMRCLNGLEERWVPACTRKVKEVVPPKDFFCPALMSPPLKKFKCYGIV